MPKSKAQSTSSWVWPAVELPRRWCCSESFEAASFHRSGGSSTICIGIENDRRMEDLHRSWADRRRLIGIMRCPAIVDGGAEDLTRGMEQNTYPTRVFC
ncbi:hypothetical protein ISN44_As09g002630 [Arabidopsis suecica]|uniref:Uncharacterized protein n=1 Tax=Arabidopsis suecica TaxID=45249 RepID=A0A8T2AI91_ARASU|nr:hypothetical protein ISN44_As09g002630 [Arabidopsis suecica]